MFEILKETSGLRVVLSPDTFAQRPDWDSPTPEELQMWRDGDVWGYRVERETHWFNASLDTMTTWEEVDSCWGFYGYDYARQSALEAFEVTLEWVAAG